VRRMDEREARTEWAARTALEPPRRSGLGTDVSAKEIASLILNWLTPVPELGETILDGLFAALVSADSYIAAGATAERIAELDSLTE
jgi:hypothetical protein